MPGVSSVGAQVVASRVDKLVEDIDYAMHGLAHFAFHLRVHRRNLRHREASRPVSLSTSMAGSLDWPLR